MTYVTIRELRNHGGDVVNRVSRGETLVVTRDGIPVAELRPLAHQGLSADTLLTRWRNLPRVDGERFRADIERVMDATL